MADTNTTSFWDKPFFSSIGADGKSDGSGMLDMSANTFGAISGQLASAITPEGTWQHNVGKVGSGLNSQQLMAIAQMKEKQADRAMMEKLLAAKMPSEGNNNVAGPTVQSTSLIPFLQNTPQSMGSPLSSILGNTSSLNVPIGVMGGSQPMVNPSDYFNFSRWTGGK